MPCDGYLQCCLDVPPPLRDAQLILSCFCKSAMTLRRAPQACESCRPSRLIFPSSPLALIAT